MTLPKTARNIVWLWAAWVILVLGFQALASMRFMPQAPDKVLEWTEGETEPHAHDRQPYLLEPFLNRQVAYDSEFYISISIAGYQDPGLRAIWLDPKKKPTLIWVMDPLPFGIPSDYPEGRPPGIPASYVAYSLNYAFFPFYPFLMRLFSFPLRMLNLNPIATATLAGVVISCLGALGGMLALYDLTRDRLDEAGALKAAFYLIVFPTGFFLAMVHTEGLFVGLAFGALALLNRKRWVWAALLAACATLTRAVGVALVIPLGIAWLTEAFPYLRRWLKRNQPGDESPTGFRWDLLWKGTLVFSPLLAYGLWNLLLGQQFRAVEAAFFGRGIFVIQQSLEGWSEIYHSLFSPRKQAIANQIAWGALALTVLLMAKALLQPWLDRKIPKVVSTAANLILLGFGVALACVWFIKTNNEQRTFYYLGEFAATIFALVASAYTLRAYPGLALFSLMVVVISFFSGGAQGMPRYILGAPAGFIMLGHLGSQEEVFDRAWTIGSVTLMGLLALLFAFNFWVG